MSAIVDMTEALHDRFYIAYAGRQGLDHALAELHRKMAETIAQRGAA